MVSKGFTNIALLLISGIVIVIIAGSQSNVTNLILTSPAPSPTGTSNSTPSQKPKIITQSSTVKPTAKPLVTNSKENSFQKSLGNSYYEITGSDENQLRAEMNLKGPVADDNLRHDSVAHWYISWDYQRAQSESKCYIGSTQVKVEVTINLPKWINQDTGSSSLVDKWNSYLIKLSLHEKTHQDFALAGAQSLYDKLTKLGHYSNCDLLDKEVNSSGEATLTEVRNKDKEYDIETSHGKTQGAVFP